MTHLHCSLLPKFPGLLPSFWTLFENEEYIGASVHAMDSKIDNGSILAQTTIKMPEKATMFSVINITKAAGGHLMVKVIKDIIAGQVNYKVNNIPKNGYYHWPTLEQIHEFRRSNISEYEAPDVDLFKYDENETDLKYSALKAENIFKYNNTFKAIRWGVTVGGLFAMHRYYRSRDLSSAVNWFCTVSSGNFFLIWVSYGL